MCLSTAREPLQVQEGGRTSSFLQDLRCLLPSPHPRHRNWAATKSLSERWHETASLRRFVFWTLPLLLRNLFYFLLSISVMCPGTLYMVYFYAVSSNRQWFAYSNQSCRQRLDVYRSLYHQPHAPTLLYFYGGAWIIGYKLFGTLLARILTAAGITVVVADYRNYPLATVPEQVKDVEQAVQWTLDHIDDLGGDSKNLVIGGESAGAHLLWIALLRRAIHLPTHASWKLSDIKGFVSCAAPVHFGSLQATFDKNRWDRPLLDCLFGNQLPQHDPYKFLDTLAFKKHDSDTTSSETPLPPIHLFHGAADRTIPVQGAYLFCEDFIQHHRDFDYTIYNDFTHIQANVQGPFRGDHRFAKNVFDLMQEWVPSAKELQFPEELASKRFCPEVLIQVGTDLMPF